MTVYVLAQLMMKDRASYDRYQARFMDIFRRYRGCLLVADEAPTLLEGTWGHDKVVLLSFPDQAAYREWAESPEYIEIAKDRKRGADAVILLLRGLQD